MSIQQQYILITGKGFKGLTAGLERNGYGYIVLKDVLEAKHPEKKLKNRVVCDFSSRESVLKTVDSIGVPIAGVTTLYDNYVVPAAWIAGHLGLPGMPADAAEACTDKQLMRGAFATAPEKISPDFGVVSNEQDLWEFACDHAFPLILKPANLAKSLLVTKNHDMGELRANYAAALENIDDVYRKYAPGRQPKLLVEEFLEGPIYSVDAFVDETGEPHVLEQIVDYQTGYDIGFEDNFHYSRLLPSKLPAEGQKALRHCAAVGIKALGMRSCPAHVEIIMTKDGPRIVEIGARNGGYRERMHSLANGLDIPAIALQLTLGQKPKIHPTKNEPCAVLELFPKKTGQFAGLENEEKLRALPSLAYLNIKPERGQRVGKASEGFKMCAVIVLHNNDQKQFEEDLNFVNNHVRVITS